MTDKKDFDQPIDFGPDADGPLALPDAAFDAWVEQVAPALNAPGTAPRAEMWDAIQRARHAADDAQAGRIAGVTPIRRAPWKLMSVIAAALLIGVAIDRYALRKTERTARPPVASAPSAADTADPSRLYKLAASQTLTQAEALLTAFRAGGATQRDPQNMKQLGSWGREVLSSTRLLLDSPAGDDPQLKTLLSDLELVLVQIIQISGAPLDPSERALIERALEEQDLLPRIRTAVPAGAADVTASSE